PGGLRHAQARQRSRSAEARRPAPPRGQGGARRGEAQYLVHDRGGLTEQDLALLLGIDARRWPQVEADRLALHHRGPLAHRLLEVAFEMREVVEILAEVLEAHQPRPDREVGDRQGAGHELTIGEALVEYAE